MRFAIAGQTMRPAILAQPNVMQAPPAGIYATSRYATRVRRTRALPHNPFGIRRAASPRSPLGAGYSRRMQAVSLTVQSIIRIQGPEPER